MKKPSAAESYVDPWRAKDDARTLMSAEEVRADKSRHSAAQKEAMKIHQQAAAAAGVNKAPAKPAPKAPPKAAPKASGKRGK